MNPIPSHRRRRHRKQRKVPWLSFSLGILLVLATALAFGFIFAQKNAATQSVTPSVRLDQPNTRKVPLSDIPHALPGDQQRRPEERSFFPKKPGQSAAQAGEPDGQPTALPQEFGLLPEN